MNGPGYVRALPKAEITATLYTARCALRIFDQNSCKRILDMGCGDAFFEEHYPERFVGVDIDPARLNQAHQRGVNGLICCSVMSLPFVDGSYDGVLMKDVLEHFYLEQAFRILHEASRVLKAGGVLIVTTTKNTQDFWDKPDHVRPYSNKWVGRVLVQELGQYELTMAEELSGGIPGFGKLRLEWLTHALANRFGIRNTHGIIALKKV